MKDDWEEISLSEAFVIKPPKKEAKEKLDGTDLVSFVPMNDLGETEKYFQPRQEKSLVDVVGSYTYFSDDDVLLAKITPCFENGKLGIARDLRNGVGFGSSEYIVFRSTGRVLPEYLYYYLTQKTFREEGQRVMSGAVGHKRVPKEFIENYRIPVPSQKEQQRIIAILDKAFAGIATATANAEKNLQNAHELFESTLQSVFTENGEGWEIVQVKDVASHCLGKMLDKNKNRGEFKSYLRNLNVRWFDFNLDDLLEMRFLPEETERYTAKKGDLMVCEGGYPGRAAIWEKDEPIFFQKAIHRVRFKYPEYAKWLLYFLYLSDATGDLRKYFTGAGIQHFTGKTLGRVVFPMPPLSVTRQKLNLLDDLMQESKKLEEVYKKKLQELTDLKQSILQKAFAGELH